MCSVYEVFLYKEKTCGGSVCSFEEIAKHDDNFFEKNIILGDEEQYRNLAKVILNKFTPEKVRVEIMSGFDICETHLNMLTHIHSTLRERCYY